MLVHLVYRYAFMPVSENRPLPLTAIFQADLNNNTEQSHVYFVTVGKFCYCTFRKVKSHNMKAPSKLVLRLNSNNRDWHFASTSGPTPCLRNRCLQTCVTGGWTIMLSKVMPLVPSVVCRVTALTSARLVL